VFTYYLDLALRSFRSARGLTVLMVLAIAMGIGASMTTITVYRALAADPIPGKSDRLFAVQLDAASLSDFTPGAEPDDQLTRFDAVTLLKAHRADRQAILAGGDLSVVPAADTPGGAEPFNQDARYATADFFPMFDVPFAFGRPWNAAEDDASATVVVLSDAMNRRLFTGANSVGRTVRLGDHDFRVIGVLAPWQPVPYFFDMTVGAFRGTEGFFLPLSTAIDRKLGGNGNTTCWGDGPIGNPRDMDAPCSWLQYWAEIDDPAKVAPYREYLAAYSAQQHAAGRFQRPPNARLRSVPQWLDHQHVVPDDVRLQTWLAAGFLVVCLVNTVGLLLAKCLRRSGEIGVRRALGAPRRQIFLQFLVEAGAIGIAGGVLGLALAAGGVWLVRQGTASHAAYVHLDAVMLAATMGLALVASLVAGVLPAWRACQVSPALQLKEQ
jgi:putative ABC transport system permease protein